MSRYTKMSQLYRDALFVQNASNLSGVVHSLSDAVSFLHKQPECTGTDWVNRHPVVVLFVNKLADMSGADSGFTSAYLAVTDYIEAHPEV